MNISDLVQSDGWRKFMAKLYGMGASVVIIGALFKINHWPGGSLVITLGLITEAIIFFFSAFEPLHEELDWTLVYPELAGMSDPDEIENFQQNVFETGGRKIESIEDVLGAAGVDNEAMKKLGENFSRLNKSAESLADLSGATVATKQFVSNLETAASSVGSLHETYNSSAASIKQSATNLSGAYLETADSIRKSGGEIALSYQQIADTIKSGHSSIASGSQEYEKQLSLLSQNLSSLNQVYQSQIKETSEQMKGSKDLYSGLHDMISNLKASVEETNKYKEEVSKLKDSISSLNTIYGNMLHAMGSTKPKN
ncbi:MAG: gliding motility protein GldL [Bacteroidota bacterium]|nr:MAG: gliding motility protein GldL [Bacteroidota bacterium]